MARRRGVCVLAAVVSSLVSPARGWAQIDQTRAGQYFKEAAEVCAREGGRLWGVSLCGPMVFADPASGTIATNGPAPASRRPPALGFANAPIEWGGTLWSSYVWAMLPATDRQARDRLFIHELFHRVEPSLGLLLFGDSNEHLDALEGRYWMRLEWRALSRALTMSGEARRDAIADALAFRAARRAAFPGSAERERILEIREGLAQYTGTVAAASSEAGAVADAVKQLADAERAPTFVAMFAYPSGAAYGVLLDAQAPGWTRRLTPKDDLGDLLGAAAGVRPAADAAAAARRYGGGELRAFETTRAAERETRIKQLRHRFVDGPVLIVPRGRGAAMITTGSTPIPGEGTVFLEYRVTGAWGRLESHGLLESSDGMTLRLAMPFRTDGATLVGDGWSVTLAPGWRVRPGARRGDFVVSKDGA